MLGFVCTSAGNDFELAEVSILILQRSRGEMGAVNLEPGTRELIEAF